jgi:hypothetical protein
MLENDRIVANDVNANESESQIDDILCKVDALVPDAVRQQFRSLYLEFAPILSNSSIDLGWTDLVTHTTDTGNARSCRQPLRRHWTAHQTAIDRHVSEMMQQGIIEPSRSYGLRTSS